MWGKPSLDEQGYLEESNYYLRYSGGHYLTMHLAELTDMQSTQRPLMQTVGLENKNLPVQVHRYQETNKRH